MPRRLIVTHHAPDLDAIGAVWILKRFDAQHYATALVAFVNPGDQITLAEAEHHGLQLHEVTHVDTGLGEFDHHQPERGQLHISATSLVHEHACTIHPDLKQDIPLQQLVAYITETDHFAEVNWPESGMVRGALMLHELVRGLEFTDPHDDTSQLHFGLQCLDTAYAVLTQRSKAEEIIREKGKPFTLQGLPCLGLETRNDDAIKLAQKQGNMLVIRKDPQGGHLRVKARPDSPFDLKPLADAIKAVDTKGTWYYHPSGKMLLNGSRKHRQQVPSPLSLEAMIALAQSVYRDNT